MKKNINIRYTEIIFFNREDAETYARTHRGHISKNYNGEYIVTIYH